MNIIWKTMLPNLPMNWVDPKDDNDDNIMGVAAASAIVPVDRIELIGMALVSGYEAEEFATPAHTSAT